MKREIPVTIRQLQLFRDAERQAAIKTQEIQAELARTVDLLAASIIAGSEQIGDVSVSLSEWRGDPPRLIVETNEPDTPAAESASAAFLREAAEADAADDHPDSQEN